MGKKASPRRRTLVDEFVKRLDAVLPWDQAAVDAAVALKTQLTKAGLVIGDNGTAIAGHAIASACVVVTNNVREFSRVPGLSYEDWAGNPKKIITFLRNCRTTRSAQQDGAGEGNRTLV